tara:strand:- start:492 stop:923 length:432 start_codon:yes stop_codon:yes gene_type:complete
MGWLKTGIDLFKTFKGSEIIQTVGDFLKKEGDYEDLKMGDKDKPSGGFLSKQAANRFGLPSSPRASQVSLVQKGIGRSRQGLTDAERILEPIHKLQANGYDTLANALIQKAIKDGNLITSRDLMPETSAHSDSQNISLGKTTL